MIDGRHVVANGRSPAVTIPHQMALAANYQPDGDCRLVLNIDGTLDIFPTSPEMDGETLRFPVIRVQPHEVDGSLCQKLPNRTSATPILVQEKKIVSNGKSPALTINKHVAEAIGLEVGSPVRFRLYSDGSLRVQLMCKVVRGTRSTLEPVVLDLSASRLNNVPLVPEGRVIRKNNRLVDPLPPSRRNNKKHNHLSVLEGRLIEDHAIRPASPSVQARVPEPASDPIGRNESPMVIGTTNCSTKGAPPLAVADTSTFTDFSPESPLESSQNNSAKRADALTIRAAFEFLARRFGVPADVAYGYCLQNGEHFSYPRFCTSLNNAISLKAWGFEPTIDACEVEGVRYRLTPIWTPGIEEFIRFIRLRHTRYWPE